MQEQIERNYKYMKADVTRIIEDEMTRIKSDIRNLERNSVWKMKKIPQMNNGMEGKDKVRIIN